MSTFLHVVQVVALLLGLLGVVALASHLAGAATPGLEQLLNRYGPVLTTLGLRLREKLTRRRK